jgi:predicted ribosomally synthesized peptide with nif11-like leader
MSEEQLSALLAKLEEDEGLQEKLNGAADIDAVVAIAKEAGFELSKADWLKHQAYKNMELTSEELDSVSGGTATMGNTTYCARYTCGSCDNRNRR